MSSAHSTTAIQCPIGLFERQEAKIEVLAKAINAAKTAAEKAPHARTLIEEAKVLLDCASNDRANENCENCQSFSELRLKTANLIVKIGSPGAAH